MDANLEEATILDTPKLKTMFRIHAPDGKTGDPLDDPSCIRKFDGKLPVPHYLGLTTLSTKYISLNSKYTGEAKYPGDHHDDLRVAILTMNKVSLKSRKNYDSHR